MRHQLPFIALSILLVAGLHIGFGLPLGYTALAILVGWPLLGTLLTADDDLPGGFSNPDGRVRPPWLVLENWGHLAFRAAIAALAFVIEFSSAGAEFWTPLLCAAGLAALGSVLVSAPPRSLGRKGKGM